MDKQDYIGTVVHGYRQGLGRHDEEVIDRVIALGNHCYDGTQHETAVKASTNKHPRPRWYIGYGSDFIPASKNDLPNIEVTDSSLSRFRYNITG